MLKTFVRFVREDSAEDLIEYGLLAAFVAAVATAVLYTLGLNTAISNAFKKAVDVLNK